jgi:hypothetical protein
MGSAFKQLGLQEIWGGTSAAKLFHKYFTGLADLGATSDELNWNNRLSRAPHVRHLVHSVHYTRAAGAKNCHLICWWNNAMAVLLQDGTIWRLLMGFWLENLQKNLTLWLLHMFHLVD